MYPVLILRCELVCLVVLVFLIFMSRSYKLSSESKAFGRILVFALIHVIFDAITVLTVNNTATVPAWLNWICHVIFYLSAIFYSSELVNYVFAICYPGKAKRLYGISHALIVIYICCLPFLPIYYVADVGTYSSAGPAAVVGYGLAFLFFLSALFIIFTHLDKMSRSIRTALIPMMLVLMVTEISQIIWRSVLFTGAAITIVTLGFFFSLENPVEVFKKKAMTDALTGVRSRNSFEEDIDRHNKDFALNPSEDYTFVFCDINDLRKVNNRFGHPEGDNYITLIATAINQNMQHCQAIYRIGGDEFLILYYKVPEEIVVQEINAMQEACRKYSEDRDYEVAVSVGYAISSPNYHDLSDVVKTADYAMYQNKANSKAVNGANKGALGTRLNYAGLTDKIFDTMCASNDRSYPFVTNLDTGVTRISPAWRQYFELEDEFYADFLGYWKDRIHPDFYEGYMADVVACINGHKKYHHFDYMAKKADGEYVKVSCHGSTYTDNINGCNYFGGYLINHGLEALNDPTTGLRNFDVLDSLVYRHMDEGKPFSLLKLRLNNITRVNMLHGHSTGEEIIKKISKVLVKELGTNGEVFCHDSFNFTILFETSDAQIIRDFYSNISQICATGIDTPSGTVPIMISGGAFINDGTKLATKYIRGALVYALDESQSTQRNALVFYKELDSTKMGTDVTLLAEIHEDALGDMQHFRLRYQPIIDIASNTTIGAEALLRWVHPKNGEIAPGSFISFLENDPCYYRLGLHILEIAIKDSKEVRAKIPGFRISVNITALQLQNDRFADDIIDILKQYEYPVDGLMLELTERCKELDRDFLSRKISELRNKGIRIAFDDLGTGYSTIQLLMDIPVDEIKLDKDFVRDIDKQENYQIFVQALILGKTSSGNNYDICFEGIETEEMLEQVRSYGNNLAQGYYFAKPLFKDEFFLYTGTVLV